MTQIENIRTPTTLRVQAADVLRRARRLPVGADRNDLRQLAIGLRCLDVKQAPQEAPQDSPARLLAVSANDAPLAPL